MADPTSVRDETRADSAEIERELELIRRHRARTPSNQPVRRLVLTVVTTALVALALWLAMR